MLVKELISRLAELPPEAEVQVADWNEQYVPPAPLTVVFHDEENNVVVLQDWEGKGVADGIRRLND